MPRTLILGRFQPPHLGHLNAIEEAARGGREVVAVLGSAQEAFTYENPFTAGERMEMLASAIDERGIRRVRVVPVADIHRHAEWVAHVENLVPPFDRVVTNNPLTKLLFGQAGYEVVPGTLYRRAECSGTKIRARLSKGLDVAEAVPPAVARILTRINAAARLRMLSRLHRVE